MRAVSRLWRWQFRNSLRTLVSDPRKFVGAIILVLLFSCSFGTFLFVPMAAAQTRPHEEVRPEVVGAIATVILLLLMVAAIDMGLGDTTLAFNPADIDYLFSSPISSRTVLAYRMPKLTFGAMFLSGFIFTFYRLFATVIGPPQPSASLPDVSLWVPFEATILCMASCMNLGVAIAVRWPDRIVFRRCLLGVFALVVAWLGLTGWRNGMDGVVSATESPILGFLAWPVVATGNIMKDQFNHAVHWSAFLPLGGFYLLSIALIFWKDYNFYEQSIVSTERVAKMRAAAKQGPAALMAAKAETAKHRSRRTYAVPPFGQGAMALCWAHLSAAAKKPFANFVGPGLLGAFVGVLGGVSHRQAPMLGFGIIAGLTAYSGFFFNATASSSSQSAIRRRDMLCPLPIKGWEAAAANLCGAIVAVELFGLGCAIAYLFVGDGGAWLVFWGTAILFPVRATSRFLLQYVVIFSYPDLADKVQQFMSSFMVMLLSIPLLCVELVVCLPALLLQSIPLALLALTIVQVPILWVMLVLAGRASDRSLASGEPVRLRGLLSGKA